MFAPATTDAGPLFVSARSDCGTTAVITVELLLLVFVSKLSVVTFAVLVTVATFPVATVSVNCALAPLPRSAMLQPTVDPPLQIAAGPLFWTIDVNVVPAGSTSMRLTFVATSGPPFATVIVYVSGRPARIVAGPDFVTDTSTVDTVNEVLDVLFSAFGSFVELSVAVFVNPIPDAVPGGTWPTSLKVMEEFAGSVPILQ